MRYHAGSFSQEFDCEGALVFFAPALLPTTETLSFLRNAPTSSLVQTFAGFPPVAGGVCAGADCDAAGPWDCDWPFAAQGAIASRTAKERKRRFMEVFLFLAGCTPRPCRGVQRKYRSRALEESHCTLHPFTGRGFRPSDHSTRYV